MRVLGRRPDGYHFIESLFAPLELADEVALEVSPARSVAVTLELEGDEPGIPVGEENLAVRAARLFLDARDERARLRIRLRKRIPAGAGLGGGSSDAGAVLAGLARHLPMERPRLHELALRLGADVPFFLEPGPKLAEGAGERLTPLELPQDFWVLVALEPGAVKRSTGEVYARFDELGGGPGFDERRVQLLSALASCRRPRDLAALPPNDLAEAAGASPLPARLRAAGAFRADVSGAGPAVFGLFQRRDEAHAAASALPSGVRSWAVAAVW